MTDLSGTGDTETDSIVQEVFIKTFEEKVDVLN